MGEGRAPPRPRPSAACPRSPEAWRQTYAGPMGCPASCPGGRTSCRTARAAAGRAPGGSCRGDARGAWLLESHAGHSSPLPEGSRSTLIGSSGSQTPHFCLLASLNPS